MIWTHSELLYILTFRACWSIVRMSYCHAVDSQERNIFSEYGCLKPNMAVRGNPTCAMIYSIYCEDDEYNI